MLAGLFLDPKKSAQEMSGFRHVSSQRGGLQLLRYSEMEIISTCVLSFLGLSAIPAQAIGVHYIDFSEALLHRKG